LLCLGEICIPGHGWTVQRSVESDRAQIIHPDNSHEQLCQGQSQIRGAAHLICVLCMIVAVETIGYNRFSFSLNDHSWQKLLETNMHAWLYTHTFIHAWLYTQLASMVHPSNLMHSHNIAWMCVCESCTCMPECVFFTICGWCKL
jgi:hypothetical protein